VRLAREGFEDQASADIAFYVGTFARLLSGLKTVCEKRQYYLSGAEAARMIGQYGTAEAAP